MAEGAGRPEERQPQQQELGKTSPKQEQVPDAKSQAGERKIGLLPDNADETLKVLADKLPEQGEEPQIVGGQDRKSVFRWMREHGYLAYAAIALFLSPGVFKNETVEAAEIPPAANWSQGIDSLRKDFVDGNGIKRATFYFDEKSLKGKWILQGGEQKDINETNTGYVAALKQELATAPTSSVKVCELRTNPLNKIQAEGLITPEDAKSVRNKKNNLAVAPNKDDINPWRFMKLSQELQGEFGGKGVQVVIERGVVDAAGVTYYSPMTERERRQQFPNEYRQMEDADELLEAWEHRLGSRIILLSDGSLDEQLRLAKSGETFNAGDKDARMKKELALKSAIEGEQGGDIVGKLFKDDREIQKLYGDLKIKVLDNPLFNINKARKEWMDASMSTPANRLTSAPEYKNLRRAMAARNGIDIRFDDHATAAAERPCRGTNLR